MQSLTFSDSSEDELHEHDDELKQEHEQEDELDELQELECFL